MEEYLQCKLKPLKPHSILPGMCLEFLGKLGFRAQCVQLIPTAIWDPNTLDLLSRARVSDVRGCSGWLRCFKVFSRVSVRGLMVLGLSVCGVGGFAGF